MNGKTIGPHWISMGEPPPKRGFYWLLSDQRFRLLAHVDHHGKWHGVDQNGYLFEVTDLYTHYTPIWEPSLS